MVGRRAAERGRAGTVENRSASDNPGRTSTSIEQFFPACKGFIAFLGAFGTAPMQYLSPYR